MRKLRILCKRDGKLNWLNFCWIYLKWKLLTMTKTLLIWSLSLFRETCDTQSYIRQYLKNYIQSIQSDFNQKTHNYLSAKKSLFIKHTIQSRNLLSVSFSTHYSRRNSLKSIQRWNSFRSCHRQRHHSLVTHLLSWHNIRILTLFITTRGLFLGIYTYVANYGWQMFFLLNYITCNADD